MEDALIKLLEPILNMSDLKQLDSSLDITIDTIQNMLDEYSNTSCYEYNDIWITLIKLRDSLIDIKLGWVSIIEGKIIIQNILLDG